MWIYEFGSELFPTVGKSSLANATCKKVSPNTGSHVLLSTAPHAHNTHWYQCRFMLPSPIAVNATQRVTGKLKFTVNERSSYNVEMELRLDGASPPVVSRNVVDLADPFYHYLQTPAASYLDHDHAQQGAAEAQWGDAGAAGAHPAQAWS